MLHYPEFLAGNVRSESFESIYLRSPVLDGLRRLTVLDRSGCSECPVRFLCAGGCWARAFFEHGTLKAADSFCEYELLAIRDALTRH